MLRTIVNTTVCRRIAMSTLKGAASSPRVYSTDASDAKYPAGDEIIGIDLGTTNSCVALVQDGAPQVLENAEGRRTTPSVVAFTKDDKMLVGDPARRQQVTNSKNTLYAVKRLIGRRHSDIKSELKNLPYKVVDQGGDAWVEVKGKPYSPAQVGAFVLQKMKETADEYLQKSVSKAVITVPAYFNDAQRQATKDAGKIAGLEVMRIINEPTAAALAYGLNKGGHTGKVIVFDLGGGTFDVSLLEIAGGVFEVKSTNGDTFLGGEDVDIALRDHFIQIFKDQSGKDLSSDLVSANRFREAAEQAKKELDSREMVSVEIPFITSDGDNFSYEFTREKFDDIIDDIVTRCVEPCKKCLKDAGIDRSAIGQVLLVGGMTRTPKVVDTVRKFFGKEPSKGVNPDEVVAQGAAIQGSILKGDTKGLVLIDVTPLSLGTEIVGGVFSRIINRNTSIPCKNEQEYTTVKDMQTNIAVKVYQGERDIAQYNQLLGEFSLDGIPPLPKGVPKIIISFELDSNGVVNVVAKDKGSGTKQSMKVQTKGGLSDEQVERMVKEAEEMREQDAARRGLSEATANAEQTISTCKDFMLEQQAKHGDTQAFKDLEQAVKSFEEVLASVQAASPSGLEEFNAETEKLKEAQDNVLKANQELYQALN
jgi:molecular chaperone DnaK|mmetsp:Transcript_2889/g.5415  ORF Transcript_2889/g.5415 Transcript_2889/m.5415 type:complete len:648 (-) Transcript_2889:438-2381(-)|eukprot:CAMPEP_0174302462 /NCGR_PEP_ID=MMETSP0809-20121228/59635_1 /TAXON_ID=73025 ORGANISM="Eutreptiella gymnastica-like, Strain CCMP1594" /NCGR_SAMPLE_ID=MMETSP0809 /ASSEMBLY_ACC=CAM_ASM_000658 /LENGTH=647 /DNA_ID=CAMNT_0015408375 /DNA_START=43 /DNA_END=1986 /DNA_ORIENTATION=+